MSGRDWAMLVAYCVCMGLFFRAVSRHGPVQHPRAVSGTNLPSPSQLINMAPTPALLVNVAGLAAEPKDVPSVTRDHKPPCEALPRPAILLLTHNRAAFLQRTLHSLLALPGVAHYPVYISQDGGDPPTRIMGAAYAAASPSLITHWVKDRPAPDPSVPPLPVAALVAQHYKWALDRVLVTQGHSHVIIVEDDMEFAFDFLNLFEKTAALLDRDETLMCISSWNDNSRTHLGVDAQLLMRTSYFPGLGWMLKKSRWMSLREQWPTLNHWDNWLRANSEYDCVVPSLPRNRNFGATGASMNANVFARDIATVGFYSSRELVDFGNLDYLLNERYEAHIRDLVKNAMPLAGLDARAAAGRKGMTYLLLYDDTPKFVALAQFFRIWQHPRSHYRFLQVIEFDQDLFLIADVRFCPLLPDHMRLLPSNAVAVVPAKEGNTCEQACAANRGTCSPQDMPWLNSCKKLKQFFPCERGCLLEAGMDLPAYVSSSSMGTKGFCVIKMHNEPIACVGMHLGTSRLCACKP